MRKRLKLAPLGLAVVIIASFLSCLIFTDNSYAVSLNSIKQKYLAAAFSACYGKLEKSIDTQELKSTKDLFSSDDKSYGYPDNETYNCVQLFENKLGINIKNPNNISSIIIENIETLRRLGYSDDGNSRTISFNFKKSVDGKYDNKDETKSILLTLSNLDTNGKVISGTSSENSTTIVVNNAQTDAGGVRIDNPVGSGDVGFPERRGSITRRAQEDGFNYPEVATYKVEGGQTYDQVKDSIDAIIKKTFCPIHVLWSSAAADRVECGSGERKELWDGYYYAGATVRDALDTYEKDMANGRETAMKNYIGDVGSTNMSEEEVSILYYHYLWDFYKVQYNEANDCSATRTEAEGKKNGYSEKDGWALTKLYNNDGTAKYCYVKDSLVTDETASEDVYGVSNSGSNYGPDIYHPTSFADIAKWLLDHGSDTVDSEAIEEINIDESENQNQGPEDLCFNSADAVGWILCPIIKTVSGALDGAYEGFIEPLLQVSPQVVQALTLEDSSGIYKAWAVFRDIANVVFVILFLVVIFSQVTGYGIDNYGIKRMLPRLIIGAVLVNFSFLICQLIVDISNIVGASLQELLMSIGRSIEMGGGDNPATVGGVLSLILGTIGVGVAAGGVAIAATTILPSLSLGSLLSIAVTVISALVAVFFGMILLGARQAIIVLLVVTSPVAFVLYLLPNTQTYFRKWVGIFSRLLLVYPAAGLLIGGGYLAAKIILSVNGGLIMNLIGLIMLVVPYFLIIPLVRSSMNAIAGLGGRLQAFGRGSSRAVRDVRRTDAYQSVDAKLRGRGMQGRIERMANVREKRRGILSRIPGGNAIAGMADMADNERMIAEAGRVESEEERRLKGEASVYGLRNPGATSAKMWQDFTNIDGDDADAVRQRKAILMAMEQNGYSKDIIKNAQNRLLQGKGRFEKNGEMMALADHLGKNGRTMDMLKDEDPEVMKYIAMRNNDGIYERDANGALRTKAVYMEDNPRVEDITRLSENGIKRGLATGRISMEDLQNTLGPNAPDSIRSRWKSSQKQIAESYMNADADSKADIVAQYTAEINSGQKDDRKMEALAYGNGGNVMGQSGAVYGIKPDASKMGGTFNADKAYRTNDGKTILEDSSRGIAWNATDGTQISGNALSAARSNVKTNYT